MYIPAENVYYETIIKGEEDDTEKALYAYATSKQVMPVSPNSFYAYLLTLAQGFRGMKIEERAHEIINHLNRLRLELERFTEDFRKVGMQVVFFAETIVGQNMPSLTYMLGYDDLAARETTWRAFLRDPDWVKLRGQAGLSDAEIVSNVSSIFLSPLPFSQIR